MADIVADKVLVQVQAEMDKMLIDTRRAADEFERRMGEIDASVQRTTTGASQRFGEMGTAIGAVVAGIAVSKVVEMADAWTSAGNTLRLYEERLGNAAGAQQRLFDIAQDAGADLSAVVATAAGVLRNKDLKASTSEIYAYAEAVSKGAAIANNGAAAVEGALTQLAQGIASPRVQLEEFNSVIEGTPRLAQAFADGVQGANGSIAKLRKMIEGGEVSGQDLFSGLVSQLPKLRQEFQTSEATIGRAMTRLRNEFTAFVGQTDDVIGGTEAVVAVLEKLSKNLDLVVAAAAVAGARMFAPMVKQAGEAAIAAGAYRVALMDGTAVQIESAAADQMRAKSLLDVAKADEQMAARTVRTTQAVAKARQEQAQAAADALNAARQAAAGSNTSNREIAEAIKQVAAAEQAAAIAAEKARLATEAVTTAQTAHVAATDRATAAMARYDAAVAATSLRARAAAASMAFLSSGMNFLGGPWGVALTVVSLGLLALSQRTTTAQAAQEALREATDTYGKTAASTVSTVDELAAKYSKLTDEMKALESANVGAAMKKNAEATKAAVDLMAEAISDYVSENKSAFFTSPKRTMFGPAEIRPAQPAQPAQLPGISKEMSDEIWAALRNISKGNDEAAESARRLVPLLAQAGKEAGDSAPLYDGLAQTLATAAGEVVKLADSNTRLRAEAAIANGDIDEARRLLDQLSTAGAKAAVNLDDVVKALGQIDKDAIASIDEARARIEALADGGTDAYKRVEDAQKRQAKAQKEAVKAWKDSTGNSKASWEDMAAAIGKGDVLATSIYRAAEATEEWDRRATEAFDAQKEREAQAKKDASERAQREREAAAESERAARRLADDARKLIEDSRTPYEVYQSQLAEIARLQGEIRQQIGGSEAAERLLAKARDEAYRKYISDLDQTREAQQRAQMRSDVAPLIAATDTPLESYNNRVDEIMSKRGALIAVLGDEEEANRRLEKAVAAARAEYEQQTTGGEIASLASDLTGAAAQADNLSDALKRVGLRLLEIAAQGLFGQGPAGGLFNKMFGVAANGLIGLAGGGGGLSPVVANQVETIFPGATAMGGRAAGGPVMAGVPYTVGEAGPERFVPETPGYIIPARKLRAEYGPGAGSDRGTINLSVNVDGATGNQEVMQMVKAGVSAGLKQVPEIVRQYDLRKQGA